MRSQFSGKRPKVSNDALRTIKVFTAVVLCCLLVFGGVMGYVVLRETGEEGNLPLLSAGESNTGVVSANILLCLTREASDYTDAIFSLFRFDGKSATISVTALAAETQLTAGTRQDRLCGHMAYGGIAQVRTALSEGLGVTVNRYMTVKLSDFATLVDQLGGVDYTIPSRLYYKEEETLVTALEAGAQHLNGTMLTQLFQYPAFEEGRKRELEVQEEVLAALLNQHNDEITIEKFPDYFSKLANGAKTDLSVPVVKEILSAYSPFLRAKNPAVTAHLKGTFSQGTFLPQESLESTTQSQTITEI